MPQQLRDLGQRSAATERASGQAVAEDVCAPRWWIQPGSIDRVLDDRRDRRGARKADERCVRANEDIAAGASWTTSLEIRGDGLADVLRQRQPLDAAALSLHRELADIPIDVVERERYDLACSQSEPSKQKQDCEIPATDDGTSIALSNDLVDLLLRDRLRQRRKTPLRNREYRAGEIDRDVAAKAEELTERTQRRNGQLYARRGNVLRAPCHEPVEVASSKRRWINASAAKPMAKELGDLASVILLGRWRDAFLSQQVGRERLLQRDMLVVDSHRSRRDDPELAHVPDRMA